LGGVAEPVKVIRLDSWIETGQTLIRKVRCVERGKMNTGEGLSVDFPFILSTLRRVQAMFRAERTAAEWSEAYHAMRDIERAMMDLRIALPRDRFDTRGEDFMRVYEQTYKDLDAFGNPANELPSPMLRSAVEVKLADLIRDIEITATMMTPMRNERLIEKYAQRFQQIAEGMEERQRRDEDRSAQMTQLAAGIVPAPRPNDEPAIPKAPKITWQRAKEIAESHCVRNPYPGNNALAKIVESTAGTTCSTSTMSKAINNSDKLRKMRAEYEARTKSVTTVPLSETRAELTAQSRESSPVETASQSTDTIFHRLLEQAAPHERAKLNALTPAQRLQLVTTCQDQKADAAKERKPRLTRSP